MMTRRDMGKFALAAFPISGLLAKPNSKFGGVQVGINAPYSFRGMPGSADDILKYMNTLGLNGLELRLQPVEGFLKAPAVPPAGNARNPLTPEQQTARAAAAAELQKWRLSQSMDGFKAFRKKYEEEGMLIQIVKYDGIDAMAD